MKNLTYSLAHVIKVTEFFSYSARVMLPRDASPCLALIKGYTPAESRVEEGKTYSYPEVIEVKFESWSNHWFSYRVHDGRWIQEGRDLNGEGLTTYQVMRSLLKELKAYRNHIIRHHEARETNALVYGETLVQCFNFERSFSEHRLTPVFRVTCADGSTSDWYGYCAQDALSNATPWLKAQPIALELIEFRAHRPELRRISLTEYENLAGKGGGK